MGGKISKLLLIRCEKVTGGIPKDSNWLQAISKRIISILLWMLDADYIIFGWQKGRGTGAATRDPSGQQSMCLRIPALAEPRSIWMIIILKHHHLDS